MVRNPLVDNFGDPPEKRQMVIQPMGPPIESRQTHRLEDGVGAGGDRAVGENQLHRFLTGLGADVWKIFQRLLVRGVINGLAALFLPTLNPIPAKTAIAVIQHQGSGKNVVLRHRSAV